MASLLPFQAAGYFALAVLALLVLANGAIIAARLGNKPAIVRRITRAFRPLYILFRLDDIPALDGNHR